MRICYPGIALPSLRQTLLEGTDKSLTACAEHHLIGDGCIIMAVHLIHAIRRTELFDVTEETCLRILIEQLVLRTDLLYIVIIINLHGCHPVRFCS